MTRRLAALAFAALLLTSGPARAFSVLVTEWGKVVRYPSPALTYVLGTYIPSSLGQAGLAAIEAGFVPWQQPSCTALTFQKTGTTTVKDVLPTGADPNGVNEVIYSQQGYWSHGYNVLGVTVPLYSIDGRIIESDIAFNPSTPWTLSTSAGYGEMNLQGVSTHEIGHFFGLQHVLDYYGWGGADMPTMVPATDTGVDEISLSTDDQLATCFLYPAQTYTCTNNAQCPNILDVQSNGQEYYKAKFTCSGGACTSALVKTGTKGYGEDCPNMWDCVEPYFCQPMVSGSICTQECNPQGANACPSGDACVPYQNSPNVGACMPGGGVVKQPLGAACTSAYECDSGLCYPNPNSSDRFCRLSCQVSKADCPAGLTCVSYTGIDYGGCVPDNLLGSLLPLGTPCAQHGDCASSVCGAGTCVKACGATNPCGAGMECATFSGKQGCKPVDPVVDGKDDGQPCGASDECNSRLCAPLPGTGYFYCRMPCVPGGACPAGHACVQYGEADAGVCMPQASPTGAPCSNNNGCTTKICHSTPMGGMVCVASCQPGQPRCAGGQTCLQDDAYGPVCVPDGSDGTGTEPEGSACSADAECTSGLCVMGSCRGRCDAFAPTCLQGQACQAVGDGNLGACLPSGGAPVGAPCTENLDCVSAFCGALGGQGQCMSVCDRTDPRCPSGESCHAVGDLLVLGVCLPDGGGGDGGDGGGGTSTFCALGAPAPATPALLLLLLLALPLTLRRRHA